MADVPGGISIAERVLGFEPTGADDELQRAYVDLMHRDELDDEGFDVERQVLEDQFNLGDCTVRLAVPDGSGDGVREAYEASIMFDGLKDVLGRQAPEHANSMTSWPVYQSLMSAYGRRVGGTALMIGSFTPLSSRSFNALASDVYGADKALIVDVHSSYAKTKEGNFIYANGAELPFRTGSINIVHTNRLLHMLEPPMIGVPPGLAAAGLVKEIARVLPKGGQLFMDEAFLYDTVNPSFFIDQLLDTGLHVAHAQTDEVITDGAFLLDRRRRFEGYGRIYDPTILTIYATKVK